MFDRRQRVILTAVLQDPRLATSIVVAWLAILVAVFASVSRRTSNKFIQLGFGPSPDLYLLDVHINTWGRWFGMNLMVFVHTIVQSLLSEIIQPWMSTHVYTTDNRVILRYSKPTTMTLANMYGVCSVIMQAISLYITFTQVDIMLVRVIATIMVITLTTYYSIRHKSSVDGSDDDEDTLLPSDNAADAMSSSSAAT